MHSIENLGPAEIERRSFEIIAAELGDAAIAPEIRPIVMRAIHTTADFDYARNLVFSAAAVAAATEALRSGCPIVTDTTMARSGINKASCAALGCEVFCHVGDDDVRAAAERDGVTRSRAAVDKAATAHGNAIFAIGNAPTALIRIHELMAEGRLSPRLIVGVPVGFVNVVESKELILSDAAPHIVARGRKGGSNVAAAIVNALLYMVTGR